MRRAISATNFRKYQNILTLYFTTKDKSNFKHFCNNSYKRNDSVNNFDIDLKIRGICVNDYIKKLEKEYADLCEVTNHVRSSRWRQLNLLIQILKERRTFVEDIKNLNELLKENDSEIKKLAEEEKHQVESKIKQIDGRLLEALFPVKEEDACDAIVLEVQAGIGGQEAMLFAKEIFDLYCSYTEYKGKI